MGRSPPPATLRSRMLAFRHEFLGERRSMSSRIRHRSRRDHSSSGLSFIS